MPFEILEKYISLAVKSALLFFALLFYNLLLIKSFTAGSGAFYFVAVVLPKTVTGCPNPDPIPDQKM